MRIETEWAVGVTPTEYKDYHKKTRVYPDFKTGSAEKVLERFGFPQPEYTHRGDNPANDKAWDKFNRLQIRLMREATMKWLEENGYEGVKISWSRKAGCSCPCSPGFVADRTLELEGKRVVDLHVK